MSEAVSTVDLEAAPVQFGRQLTAARESCGFSIAEVARQLRLSPLQVEAMESGDYQRLPGPVFARGFIRNYARLVKLDPEVLLASAEQRLHPAVQEEPEFPHSFDIPFPTGREIKWRKYGIAAAVVLVLLVPMVILDFYREDTTELTAKSGPVKQPQPQVVEREQAAIASAVPQIAAAREVVIEPALTKNATALSEKSAAETSALPANAAAMERKSGEHLLKLTFDMQSCVEIHDRTGRRIFSRLNAAGTEQAVSGEPPLTLVVGNARGVRLTHNGQPVDLAPHTTVSVARLTLE
jgi:cytoskeleton protein RodZ